MISLPHREKPGRLGKPPRQREESFGEGLLHVAV